ncbi:anthranilate synthase component I [Psychrobacillus lasiicapitis]|uniref:Anthranilate synthase component 1 n=1 Tax=Psychrobacillus lasiicapitis TaxID=1636719 RepID=A0A544T972_9BACI|nr:anthranilate synthase component I [Psychrobacillus lasiicapitis]TQR14010.1 anthranilate synthase component I [Psychrobacillus lasiicapitis]GGA37413.1 anthranilate synthase component I [Psychrobacillus lasiicapitis]
MTVETRSYEMKEIQGDMMTPISIYQSINGRKKMLFESSAKHEESGRYSFIALNPIAELIGDQSGYTLSYTKGETEKGSTSVIEKLKNLMPIHMEKYPFAFFGGAIGYFGYETAFYHEKIGELLPDELEMPDIHLMFYDTFIIFDHLKQTVTIAAIDLFQTGRTQQEMASAIETIYTDLQQVFKFQEDTKTSLAFQPNIEQATFIQMVERAKEHIVKGDIFQIVLSQRFSSPFEGNPFALYRQLRTSNPSPYMFYMEFEKYTILGTSPESLVKVNNGMITTNPIAGTKPRGKNSEEDMQIAKDLLNDEKEIAEHRMLVDLGRNDIGRISEIGSVQIEKYMKIEYYKYVMHIVSEVTGRLMKDLHVLDVLTACLPAGTVSGAPKIRAMQIINDLETTKRGVYAGAVGYISVTGNMDLALAIRTMVVKDGLAHVQAGAGIVFDSIPKSEYEETINKAKALLEVQR